MAGLSINPAYHDWTRLRRYPVYQQDLSFPIAFAQYPPSQYGHIPVSSNGPLNAPDFQPPYFREPQLPFPQRPHQPFRQHRMSDDDPYLGLPPPLSPSMYSSSHGSHCPVYPPGYLHRSMWDSPPPPCVGYYDPRSHGSDLYGDFEDGPEDARGYKKPWGKKKLAKKKRNRKPSKSRQPQKPPKKASKKQKRRGRRQSR